MNDTFLPGNGFDTYESQDKVLVGMSGGVDSSVTVRILQQQGFGVVGAVIRFSPAHEEAVAAAHKAAQQLGVECITLDAQELFDQQVVQPFCQQYCAGRTPNPCVMCNPAVKFQALLTAADRLGIQYIATGHYARVELGEDGVSRICQPESAARDQSYMLGRLDQQVLSRLLLPLGEFEKEDIREMARDFGLDCADAPDSMEICFVPDGDYAAYIAQRGYTPKAGHFLSPDGADLGPHQGVLHYTVGQRKGLGISFGKPMFVTKIDPISNTVTLGENGSQYASSLIAGKVNLISADTLEAPISAQVKVRYQAPPAPARLTPLDNGKIRVDFQEPQRSVTPGQAAVFYDGDLVLGGGIIETV